MSAHLGRNLGAFLNLAKSERIFCVEQEQDDHLIGVHMEVAMGVTFR